MRYSIESRDLIHVEDYGILSLAKNTGESIEKNLSKNWSGKYSQNFLNHVENLLRMHLKLLQKKLFKKEQKQLVICLAIKFQITLEPHHQTLQRLSQVRQRI